MISFRKIALLLAVPGVLALPAPASAGTYYSGSNAIAVYDYNVNRMDRAWSDWASAIKSEASAPVPDIVLGQDFQNNAERDQFRDYLSSASGFGVQYSLVASASTFETNPDNQQQRVVFWRTNRFTLDAVDRWFGYGGDPGDPNCVDGATNAQAVQVRLKDNNNGNYVAAVSMKTPPKGTNVQCAWQNMVRANSRMNRTGYSGALHLVGTDANAPDYESGTTTCWYGGTVLAAPGTGCGVSADLGFSDPMYDNCTTAVSLTDCLKTHWTHQGPNGAQSRIDFIFAKRGLTALASSTDRKTIDKNVCATYSDHCSVRALVYYA